MPDWMWTVVGAVKSFAFTLAGVPMRRLAKLERDLALHEGGWVQLMLGRRVIWLTKRAYDTCYLGLDDSARGRADRAIIDAGQDHFDLADMERLSR